MYGPDSSVLERVEWWMMIGNGDLRFYCGFDQGRFREQLLSAEKGELDKEKTTLSFRSTGCRGNEHERQDVGQDALCPGKLIS